jgi:hypothetical protein
MAMSVFTAYVGLVLRWCGLSETVVQYQTNGRADPKRENTIGYFASLLCLRIGLSDDDRFVDLLRRVKEEYCKAHEHTDLSYMAAQMHRREFARNSIFNWVPQGYKSDLSELPFHDGSVTSCDVPFENPAIDRIEWDNDPEIVLFDTEDNIIGNVCFEQARFATDTMERLGSNLLVFLKTLMRRPETRVKELILL